MKVLLVDPDEDRRRYRFAFFANLWGIQCKSIWTNRPDELAPIILGFDPDLAILDWYPSDRRWSRSICVAALYQIVDMLKFYPRKRTLWIITDNILPARCAKPDLRLPRTHMTAKVIKYHLVNIRVR